MSESTQPLKVSNLPRWLTLVVEGLALVATIVILFINQERSLAAIQVRVDNLEKAVTNHFSDPNIHHQGIRAIEKDISILQSILTELKNMKEDIGEMKIDIRDLKNK